MNSPIRSLRLARVVLPAFGLIILAALIYTTMKEGLSPHILPGLLFGLFFCLSLILLPLMSMQKQKAFYAKSNGICGRLAIDIDDEGIQFRGPLSSSKMSWPAFSKSFEDEKAFIFFQKNERTFHLVPKRFLSPEQTLTVRQFFERHVGRG